MTKKSIHFDLNNFPKWNEFNWIKYEIDNSLEALRKLHEINKNAYDEIYFDLEEKISRLKEDNKDLSQEDLSHFIQHSYGIDEQIVLELDMVQKSSLIIYAFAIFENKLKILTEKIKKDFKINISSKKSNSYTSDYWRILRCFSELNIISIEKFFISLKCQMIIRNIIVHQNNILNIKQYKNIRRFNGLTFNEFEDNFFLVKIENEFIEQLILEIELFFSQLLLIIKYESNNRLIGNTSQ